MSKSLALALAAFLGSATLASADFSYFALQPQQDRDSLIELDLVRSATAGVVEIRDLNSGVVLGSQSVNAGANTNVHISIGARPVGDVMAVLTANGQVLAQDRIRVDRD